MSDLNHIFLNGNNSSLPYSTYGGGKFHHKDDRDRRGHGSSIKSSFRSAVSEFTDGNEEYEFVYIEFESALNFELAFDSFEDVAGNYRLASCRAEFITDFDNNQQIVYKIAVYLNKKAVSIFLNKVEKYLTEETITGKPKNQNLIANIENIRAATLESFWQEPEIDFPSSNVSVWWEVWFSDSNKEVVQGTLNSLVSDSVKTSNRLLVFPENIVGLIKATPEELSEKLLYINNLAEIRKPVETSNFFTNLDKDWEGDFINDLRDRINNQIEQNNVSVCLLDSGVNRVNPLLIDLIPERNLDSVNPTWTNSDSYRHGHGTPMAGLIIYGDLNEPLSSSTQINVSNNIESIKIIDRTANDPDLYGQITLEAISIGEIMNPDNKRIVCLAVTSPDNKYLGRPSSWSAAIDQKMFGSIEERNDNTIILVSSGNLSYADRLSYPIANDDLSIEDPAQAFNAITIGAYTNKDRLDVTTYPGAELLAQRGQMSPCNTTSISWNKTWPKKPDVVFEGGNDGIFNTGILDEESLKLLSTGVGGIGRSWLSTIADTSAATALAARFAAELYQKYPSYLPETIRALIIHSADWNNIMLNNRSLSSLSSEDKSKLLARVGYGVPNLNKAKYSAENSLSIIAERTLKPFKFEESRVKTNIFHLFDLPWPTDILSDLAELDVKLIVTLSYFIEPNPGNKRYASDQSYKSHGLRFKMIDKNESIKAFQARVSKAIKEEQGDYVAEGSENWILGSQVRDKGSIHKDIWVGAAADLALRNKIAIYPVGGWWKNRKKLNRYDSSVRYSLIISIETNEADIDIYNDVLNQIKVTIPIDV
ncbi:S8 family peptidase [Wenyingzhuangia sp. 2_MG-2023]|uniref:S8 family peptidase n=1 Tax=Wenyingzhuangia sp. 2_MG-2023 TaxID=3062639 RepID=UPI0026E41549|nr:S8 family peptidase [Wenyingzhuangia sp. 2_MG-2023]MDO6737422.1 S8 family peptidase [Wenyingzhuangia sp. 2_MG-2023]